LLVCLFGKFVAQRNWPNDLKTGYAWVHLRLSLDLWLEKEQQKLSRIRGYTKVDGHQQNSFHK
jgi:hypothetical protein